ncbi:MAG: hypothetical protein AAGD38_21985, partial [Acidobacteriota bacterium]
VAAAAAAERSDIAFVVLLSSPGLPGKDVVVDQAIRLERVDGTPEPTLEDVAEQMRAGIEILLAPLDEEERARRLRPIIEATQALTRDDPFASAASIDRELAVLTSASFRSALTWDPRPALERLRCPVLVLHGELDMQVDPERNLPPLEAALEQAPTDDVTIVRLPGLNHLLQPAETGHPREYAGARRDPAVYDRIATWIVER